MTAAMKITAPRHHENSSRKASRDDRRRREKGRWGEKERWEEKEIPLVRTCDVPGLPSEWPPGKPLARPSGAFALTTRSSSSRRSRERLADDHSN